MKGQTCSTPRPFLAQTGSGSRASGSADEDAVTTTPGFNWSLWAKVPGEGRADHEEGLVGRGGSAEPGKAGCFQSGHPDPVTRTCMSWRDTSALHDTFRLHSIHCCIHQTCYVTATATQPSLIKWRPAEDGGGPLDASRPPCEIGQSLNGYKPPRISAAGTFLKWLMATGYPLRSLAESGACVFKVTWATCLHVLHILPLIQMFNSYRYT